MGASDPSAAAAAAGPVHDLLRLQTDFQQRLASETLRYLRQLQGLVGPTVPGTLVLPDAGLELHAEGGAGASLMIEVVLENRQRVHTLVSASLSPLVSDRGVTWFVEAEIEPASVLLASGDVRTISLGVATPLATPPGIYRGALLLHGFERGALPVRITVVPDGTTAEPARKPARKRKS